MWNSCCSACEQQVWIKKCGRRQAKRRKYEKKLKCSCLKGKSTVRAYIPPESILPEDVYLPTRVDTPRRCVPTQQSRYSQKMRTYPPESILPEDAYLPPRVDTPRRCVPAHQNRYSQKMRTYSPESILGEKVNFQLTQSHTPNYLINLILHT